MTVEKLTVKPGVDIAYHKIEPKNDAMPSVVFLGGFMSDMEGSKATFLQEKCAERGQGFVRFDYTGHGSSSGYFTEGTIGSWCEDAAAVLTSLTEGPQILIGSSMGGWVSLMLALKYPERVAGLIGIAAAPDFTQEMYEELLDDAQKHQLEEEGLIYIPSDYGEPYPITEHLIEEAKNHLLLDQDMIAIDCPVRLLHGRADAVVPWQKSVRIQNLLRSEDVDVHFVEEGDHSLSCEAGLRLLDETVHRMSEMTGKHEEMAESS